MLGHLRPRSSSLSVITASRPSWTFVGCRRPTFSGLRQRWSWTPNSVTQPNLSTIHHKIFLRINQCPDRIKIVHKISIMVKQSNKPISSPNLKKLKQYNTIAIYLCPVGYYFRNQEHQSHATSPARVAQRISSIDSTVTGDSLSSIRHRSPNRCKISLRLGRTCTYAKHPPGNFRECGKVSSILSPEVQWRTMIGRNC